MQIGSMPSPNKLSILYSKHIDAETEQLLPVKTEHGWTLPLNLSYSALVNKVLSELPENLLPLVSNVIIAGSHGDSTAKEELHKNINQGKTRTRPSQALQSLGVIDLSWLYPKLNSELTVFSVETACSSGIKALQLASIYGNTGATMIISAEVSTVEFIKHIFGSIGALSKADTWVPPFYKDVSGIMLGDGAAVTIVSSKEYADQNNLPSEATIESIGFQTIPTHPTRPSDPLQLQNLIYTTIQKSGIDMSNFSYWDAHATATPTGDAVEIALHEAILPNVPIRSYKSKIGHALGASSLVELVAAIKNFSDDTNKTFLKCSFGFGGQNGIVVVTVS